MTLNSFYLRWAAAMIMALLSTSAKAADFNNTFLFPAGPDHSQTFHYLETITVSWISNFTKPTLWLFCRGDGDAILTKYQKRVGEFNNTQNIALAFSDADRCWLNLRSENEKYGINGPEWLYDPTQQTQTTTGPSSSSITSMASNSTSAPTSSSTVAPDSLATVAANPTTASSSTPVPADSSSNNLSTGAKAGIGAGAAVATLLIFMTLILLFMRKRREQREAKSSSGPASELSGSAPPMYQAQDATRYSEMYSPQEHHHTGGSGGGTWVSPQYLSKVGQGHGQVAEMETPWNRSELH